MAFIKITGVLPPMITPFTDSGELDLAAHQANVARWNHMNLAGFLALGSNSEAVYLSETDKLELIKATIQAVDKDKLMMAGTGLESTKETIRLTNLAAKAGADCALVLTPNYYQSQMGDEAQRQFFLDVADHSDIPILMYNVTKFTGINLSPRVVQELSYHPNIIGMKDSAGDRQQLQRFFDVIGPEFNLIVGTASAWYEALDLGIDAAIMALANILPKECSKIRELYHCDKASAQALNDKLRPLNQAVTATYGVAGLKYAANLLGYQAGFVRRPLLEIDEEAKQAIKDLLQQAGVL